MRISRALTALVATCSLGGCGDNMHPGGGALIVSPQTGLFTDESGTTATFSVMLSNPPVAPVTVTVTSLDTDEGTATPSSFVLDASNFATSHTVTVTGVDDARADGDRAYAVRVGTDLLGAFDIDVINGDDDIVGARVTPVVGLMTSEAGLQATFSVVLTSQPSATVSIPVQSSDATEGTVSATMLTFTTETWNTPQTVTVTGVQDAAIDGSTAFSVVLGAAASADLAYDGFDADDVQVLNVDDDVFGIAVTPAGALATTEAGGTDTLQVVLQTQPSATVTIPVSSSNPAEATASAAQLVFTTASWNVPQTITVTGVNDAVDDDDKPFTLVLGTVASGDASYSGVDPADVAGTNADDDTAAIVVSPASVTTTEGGGVDTFTVVLGSQPTSPVTIAVSSNDATEGLAAPAQLVFDASNWMTPRTVTVTGQNDGATDGDIAYAIVLTKTTADTKYAALALANVTAVNKDNDIPGFTFDPTGGLIVSEFQDSDQFAVTLNTMPAANVTIAFSSTNPAEGVITTPTLTFTPANWNVAQFVNLTGVNDTVADGDQAFTVVTGPVTSSDPAYNGIDPPDLDALNIDNDTAAIYVKARKRITVSETGTSAIFRVRLTVAPTANVTCPVQSSDTTEGTVSPATVSFTPGNFGFRNVTVTGVDDNLVDGDVAFTIQLGACTSTDLQYNGVNPRDVAAVNRDND